MAIVGIPPENLEDYELPEAPISCGIDGVLSRIFKNNPVVVVASNKLKVAEAILDETISPFLPTIRAQLESNAPVLNQNGVKGKENTYTAQMVLDYNLLKGGKDVANRAAQVERVVEAKKRVSIARRESGRIGRSAWARYFSADRQAIELTKDVEVNQKLSRAYEIQFALVSRPLLDLLDAYVSYYRSETDLISVKAEKDTNHALLLASMGDLVSYIVPEATTGNENADNAGDEPSDNLCQISKQPLNPDQ